MLRVETTLVSGDTDTAQKVKLGIHNKEAHFSPHSMLYQTHHPPLFQFHPFTSSTTPHLSTTPSYLPSLLLSQAETEMECLEAALKSSVRKDTTLKLSPQTFLEELTALNVQNVASCDDFFVDDLLDFSLLEKEEPDQHNHDSACVSPQNKNQEIYNYNPSFNDHFTSELTVPAEEVADLEWLSHFVEDSFSEHSISFPVVTATQSLAEKAPEPGNTGFTFKTPVPAKARSKRTRTGVRVWPLRSPSFTDTSSTSSSSSSSSSPSSPLLICAAATPSLDPEEKRAKKRAAPDGGAVQTARRCSHCGVQKTPQWRTGPLGPKTLCNACGVRYKSGRLLPEYRPACSPTFSSELHSNHHRKVLEMRRKNEVAAGPDAGSTPSVPGF
ncbi:GATA transcription factor 5, partial [Mucuna pruriens]